MEVVLALALFVGAATVITSGLNASVREVDRLRLNLHASALANSILAEMEMGLKPLTSTSPEPWPEPFEMWTWQSEVGPLGEFGASSPLQNVEIIVRHRERNITCRVAQWIPLPMARTEADSSMDEPETGLESIPAPTEPSP